MEFLSVIYRGKTIQIQRLPNGKFKKPSLSQFTKQGLACTWLDDARIPIGIGDKKGQGGDHKEGETHNWCGHRTPFEGERRYTDGRFPANLLVSDDAVDDGIHGHRAGSAKSREEAQAQWGKTSSAIFPLQSGMRYGDIGGFSRFFSLDKWWQAKLSELPESVQRTFPFLIVPKAGKKEKNLGCEGLAHKSGGVGHPTQAGKRINHRPGRTKMNTEPVVAKNNHPTVKPLKLMSYLVTLGSRPGDLVLDPFAGTCTTGMAAKMLGRNYLMIEIDEQWCRIGRRRVEAAQERML